MFMQITSIKLSRKLSQFLSDWFKTNSIKQQTNKTEQNKIHQRKPHKKNQSITQIMIKPFSSKGELYFETFIHMSYA
jgi:hypothetical protein